MPLIIIGVLLILTLTILAPAAVVAAWKVARWQGIITAWIMLLVLGVVYYATYLTMTIKLL